MTAGLPESPVGLSAVHSGWDGSIRVVIGSATINHDPSNLTTSAAEVWSTLIRRINQVANFVGQSVAVTGHANANGPLTIESDTSFTLVFLTATDTRDALGFTSSTYAGAFTRTSEGAHTNGYYPADGVSYQAVARTRTAVGLSANNGIAQSTLLESSDATISIPYTWENAWNRSASFFPENAGGLFTFDLWQGGVISDRFVTRSVSTSRHGQRVSRQILKLQCRSVGR